MDKLSAHEASAFEQALRISREGDIAAAERLFHTVLKTNYNNSFVFWCFGYEYIRHEMYRESLHCFRRAIEIDDRCAWAWGGLGRALKSLELWDDAEAALRRRLELGESATHYVYLAAVLSRQSKHEDALTCCDRALQLDDRQVDALVRQGFVYSQLGLHEKAAESCRRAISIDPHYDEPYVCLGVVLSRADELEDAADAFQRAIDINPQCADAYREYGRLQRLMGDPTLAESYLQTSVDLSRNQKRDRD